MADYPPQVNFNEQGADDYKGYPDACDPIDFKKDDDDIIVNKINRRIEDSSCIWKPKKEECEKADNYLDGHPEKSGGNVESIIYNPLFPIVRNMTGLTTDSRPSPSARVVKLSKDTPKKDRDMLMSLSDKVSTSLEEWWDDNQCQSKLQQTVFALYVYADYYWFPFWNNDNDDADFEPISPSRVHIDQNATGIHDADYVVVDFFRTKQRLYEQFGKEVIESKKLTYRDHKEIVGRDENDGTPREKMMKNVVKLQLYMQKDWWVYKVGDKIIKKQRNPFWATDGDTQREDISNDIKNKYQQKGIKGMANKAVNAVKGAVGMETTDDKITEEIQNVLANFSEKTNYFVASKIPLVQFDTYRMPEEIYSRSIVMQSIPTLNEISKRKNRISDNADQLGQPNIIIDGNIYNEDDAKKITMAKSTGRVLRVKTKDGRSVTDSVKVMQGTPVPTQFFTDLGDNLRELDNLWGHHDVSKGQANTANETKGGILALQEADQTPIRFITRNLEDHLQEVFEWVIQLRKLFMDNESMTGNGFLDYNLVDRRIKVYVKSGSMMPISKEAQRSEALELWAKGAIDPLTLHERLNDPDPEMTANRLMAWQRGQILDEDTADQTDRVKAKIKLIQANQFSEVEVADDDDPKIHFDMLKLALQNGKWTPEQEQFIAKLLQQYLELAKQDAQSPVESVAGTMPPESAPSIMGQPQTTPPMEEQPMI